ncbi:hypothetical protein SAMN03159382_03608 [Pseudomonas sp. NFACC23-1]|nr:hypothetical protein SAMN03159386_03478 [Pseudomonas sp. NFACC17-2]SEJ65199.1 hypothetical protein SAMN03159382_03608 [Pseudomonas sp. NFACC23-1]SFW81889.1 hypothetical protein SAMN05660640_03956 [Pseudomonas sp. NFACC16-2]
MPGVSGYLWRGDLSPLAREAAPAFCLTTTVSIFGGCYAAQRG